MDDLQFFDTVLPSAGLRCIAVPATVGYRHIFGDSNAWLAQATKHIDTTRQANVFYAVASYVAEAPSLKKKRTQENVAYVRSFWADLDVGVPEPGKPPKYDTAREAATAVLAFAAGLGLPRPFLVSSGRGVHAYWPMDADMLPSVWKGTAQALKRALVAAGVKHDPSRTADQASILRPPGCHHRKAAPKPVRVVVEGEVGTLHAFQQILAPWVQPEDADPFAAMGAPPAAAVQQGLNSDLTAGVTPGATSSAHRIADACGIIAMVRDTRGLVDQPTWFHSLSVLGLTEEAPDVCHAWSMGDPRYTPAETNAKLAQLAKIGKPSGCDKVGEQHAHICAACPHRGEIKTPWVLGIDRPKPFVETVRQEVVLPSGEVEIQDSSIAYPWSYQSGGSNGHYTLEARVEVDKDDKGNAKFDFVKFCDTRFYAVTRLWVDGVAHVEWEMDMKDGVKRRFVTEAGMIGKGKDTLAGELARNEIMPVPGMERVLESYVKAWFTHLKQNADQVVAYQSFGWSDDQFVLGDMVLQPDGSAKRAVLMRMAKAKQEAVSCRGDLGTWVQLVDRAYNAPGQEVFQFQIACSFAAPLLSLMQQVKGVTVYAHSEGSGVGKTTVQRVGLSAWGDWESMMLAHGKATTNMLWGLMGAYNSLPIVYDEVTNAPNDYVSELVFSVSSGRAKERMNAAGEARTNNSNWSTILLASGNTLLSEKLALHRANAEAEISRLFEFTVEASPHLPVNEANAIFPRFSDHYGHAGRVFMQYVVQNREEVQAALATMQAKLTTRLQLTQVERHWSALFASVLVALSYCRALGLLQFDTVALRNWMFDRLRENRGQREASVGDPAELVGLMLADLWGGILVTEGEGDLRKGVRASVLQHPRGSMSGRAIVPVKANETAVLLLSVQAVRDWTNKKGVSAREMLKAAVARGWATPSEVRFSLGKGTVEYSQVTSYLPCWKLDPAAMAGGLAGSVAQKLGVINGGKAGTGVP